MVNKGLTSAMHSEGERRGEAPGMAKGLIWRAALAGGALALLAACTSLDFGPLALPDRTIPPAPKADIGFGTPLTTGGLRHGQGPVQVALLVPLSGEMGSVGTAMANAGALAISFIEANPQIADNITLLVKDTGPTPSGAAQAAVQAIADGAQLILGPVRADQMRSVGQVARGARITVIGFSNNPGAAGPGVYLLNVLPDTEVRRSIGFAQTQGRRGFAAIVPATTAGDLQEAAFRQVLGQLNLRPASIQAFNGEAEARTAIERLAAEIMAGAVDTLFIPDRASAPMLATLLAEAGVRRGSLTIIGSGDWDKDMAIADSPFLAGALYPGLDDAGYRVLAGEYAARFGGTPPAYITLAYTATILANASSLSRASPPYPQAMLTVPGGFNGRDGVFRLKPDGRSDFALVMRKLTPGGAVVVDGPRL